MCKIKLGTVSAGILRLVHEVDPNLLCFKKKKQSYGICNSEDLALTSFSLVHTHTYAAASSTAILWRCLDYR